MSKRDPVKHRQAVIDGIRAAQPEIRRRAMLTQHLIGELAAIDPFVHVTKARLMIMRLVELATKESPDLQAMKEIFDRVEGKTRQQVDVTHDGDVTVRSAAVSVLDELIAEVTGRNAGGSGKDSLPN